MKKGKKYIFENGTLYKINKAHIFIQKAHGDSFNIEFKRLINLEKINKSDILKLESPASILRHREHSKHAIWINALVLSREALNCLKDFHTDQDPFNFNSSIIHYSE